MNNLDITASSLFLFKKLLAVYSTCAGLRFVIGILCYVYVDPNANGLFALLAAVCVSCQCKLVNSFKEH